MILRCSHYPGLTSTLCKLLKKQLISTNKSNHIFERNKWIKKQTNITHITQDAYREEKILSSNNERIKCTNETMTSVAVHLMKIHPKSFQNEFLLMILQITTFFVLIRMTMFSVG